MTRDFSRGCSLLRRIVGRIDMVRLLRDSVLILFGLLVALAMPILSDILFTSAATKLSQHLITFSIVVGAAIPYGFLLYWLGKLEERQQDKRDQKLVEDILAGLGYSKEPRGEHFESVL